MNKKIYLNMCDKKECGGPMYVIEQGDTLYSIAQKYHTRVRILLDLNPFVDVYHLQPGDEICIPSGQVSGQLEFRPYVVKENETIGDILQKISMSFEELAKMNKVLTDHVIRAGTILLIPVEKPERP
ncbi:MAG: LysM domain-containing protein [Clostridiales bacterium]|nr:LysM domain-containing protein [Clostridiales bacterium]